MKMTRKIISMAITMAMVFAFGFNSVSASTYNSGIEAFVNSLYSDCLGRSADPTGFNDWCNKLSTGQVSGKQCAYGFFFSPEFQAKAGRISADELINTYYKVFLNRDADPAGKTYWSSKIASTSTADDIIILFNGFADSIEFANKCASYGITVGTVSTPAVGTTFTQTTNANNLAAQTNGTRANSVEELDAYWTSQGYEIMYIDLGNSATQKVYAHFYDMTDHNNQLNAWRNQNGLPSLALITDPNDPRVQWVRTRAIEVAYHFAHRTPRMLIDPNICLDDRTPADEAGENIAGGVNDHSIDIFRNSYMHNAAMLDDWSHSFVTACCNVVFVNPDGVTTTTTSPSTGTSRATVQLFYY